jgi:hypothetical protein
MSAICLIVTLPAISTRAIPGPPRAYFLVLELSALLNIMRSTASDIAL